MNTRKKIRWIQTLFAPQSAECRIDHCTGLGAPWQPPGWPLAPQQQNLGSRHLWSKAASSSRGRSASPSARTVCSSNIISILTNPSTATDSYSFSCRAAAAAAAQTPPHRLLRRAGGKPNQLRSHQGMPSFRRLSGHLQRAPIVPPSLREGRRTTSTAAPGAQPRGRSMRGTSHHQQQARKKNWRWMIDRKGARCCYGVQESR